MITTNQKPIICTQKVKGKKPKHKAKNHQTVREETKRRKKQKRTTKPTGKIINKMAIKVHTYQ